jgi:hypothetical protein
VSANRVRLDGRAVVSAWMAEDLLKDVDVIAAVTAYLLETERTWVTRRTDCFTFLDGRRVGKTVRVETKIPDELAQVLDQTGNPEQMYLPILRPRKRFLRNLDIRDEDGSRVTPLTRDANALIATRLLTLQARAVVKGAELDPALILDFADLTGLRWSLNDHPGETERYERASSALEGFRRAHTERSAPGNALRCSIWDDPILRGQIVQLIDRFILFVPIELGGKDRRSFDLTYESDVTLDQRDPATPRRFRDVVRLAFRGTGIAATYADLWTRGPFAAASYHAEVLAPDDLTVLGARLRVATTYRVSSREKLTETVDLARDWGTPRVHLFANGRARELRDGDTLSRSYVRVRLVPRAGIVLPVFIIALVLFATLTGGIAARIAGYHAASDTVGAVLLALPALYATYLLPQGHPLLRRLYSGFRAILVVLTGLAYGAAASLAIDLGSTARYVLWSVFDAIAIVCLLVAGRALARSAIGGLSRP